MYRWSKKTLMILMPYSVDTYDMSNRISTPSLLDRWEVCMYGCNFTFTLIIARVFGGGGGLDVYIFTSMEP